jgi:hypothetical protein
VLWLAGAEPPASVAFVGPPTSHLPWPTASPPDLPPSPAVQQLLCLGVNGSGEVGSLSLAGVY